MSAPERVLAAAVIGRDRLGPLACPILLDLVEVDCEGALVCAYWIRAYRIDEPEALPGGWPFAATYDEGGVGPVRDRVRKRWREATLEELPTDVFGDGVSA